MNPAFAPAVRRILATEVGDAASTEQVAQGAVRIVEKLGAHLTPLIGDLGTRIVLDRGLRLTATKVPRFARAGAPPAEGPWSELRGWITEQPAEVAMEAMSTFLEELLSLLARLIGSSLAIRLLPEIWPEEFAKEAS